MTDFLVKKLHKLFFFRFSCFFLIPAKQWGSVQKFWKFARLLSLIWAFRKSTWGVDMNKSIFLDRRFSQTFSLKKMCLLFLNYNRSLSRSRKILIPYTDSSNKVQINIKIKGLKIWTLFKGYKIKEANALLWLFGRKLKG